LLPPCLADAVRKVELHDNGTVKRSTCMAGAWAHVLLKHLGGLAMSDLSRSPKRKSSIAVADERRAIAVLAPLARARGTTIDCDPAQEPAEQSPTNPKPHK
jgi:hypothetical protein